MTINEAKEYLHKWVINELDPDNGRYCMFKVNRKTNKVNIQRADQKKSRWVDPIHLIL